MEKIIALVVLVLFLIPAFGENVNIFWDANTEPDVTSYNVYRGDDSGGPYTVINTVPQTANPMYSDAGVDLTTDKFYVVTAVNSGSQESPFSNEAQASALPPATPPSAPTVTITITVSP